MSDTTPNALSFTTNGGPAFPLVFDCGDGTREIYSGMSLRDWFAGLAMQALITRTPMSGGERARDAYIIADAMLKERNK